jgi:type I restriction enzyme R subunit
MLASDADISIVGGGRGGGKSAALIFNGLYDYNNPNFRAIIFRKELDDLSDIIDTSNDFYKTIGTYNRAKNDLMKKVSAVAGVAANIPQIMAQKELIEKILHTNYVENAGINEFEYIREKLRDLMKYIPNQVNRYDTDFGDEILSMEWKESELENDDLKNYKAKAEYYVRQHQDNIVIAKLKSNKPLTSSDVKVLEDILWGKIGTKQEYEAEYGEKPLGEFVREIVGLDMNAAKEAFSEYLDETNLDSRQIYFVNQIVEYIVHNGMMKDLSVLQETPFTDQGSIVEIFTDLSVWMGIRKAIEQINANAVAV